MKNILFVLIVILGLNNLEAQYDYLYSEVDKLSVRRSPSLDAKRVASLDEGERVIDLGQTSRNVISVKLRGERTRGPFYLIRTRKGIEGWVYSRALSSRKVYVEDYVCVVAFSKYRSIPEGLKRAIRNYDDCFNRGDNFSYKFLTRGFREVNITNSYGEIIGVENISRQVDKYGKGILVLQKGKKPVYYKNEYQHSEDDYLWSEDFVCTWGHCECY